jgi:hypothetical protein
MSGSHVVDALLENSLGCTVFGMFIAHVLYIWSESTIAKRDGKIQLTFEGHQNEQKYIAWTWNLRTTDVPVSTCNGSIHIL